MDSETYLAMTAQEISVVSPLPPKIAWMACHFSPYGTGITNLPQRLPEGSILILNDRIPICGHDPERIAPQLQQTVDTLGCSGVLLDFQLEHPELLPMAAQLTKKLSCPTAVSDRYADRLDCPVFLSACPHHKFLTDHIAPWQGREIWLDLAMDAERITLTEAGAAIHSLPLGGHPPGGHWEEELHCHYSIETGADVARFTLWRTREDLQALAQDARRLGIQTLVGFWQEQGEVISSK